MKHRKSMRQNSELSLDLYVGEKLKSVMTHVKNNKTMISTALIGLSFYLYKVFS